MKRLLALSLLTLVSTNLVFADFKENSSDCSIKNATIVELSKMDDDSWVNIQGNIVKKSGDDLYVFKDSTGSLLVEIDNDKWNNGISADTKDLLELTGELEKKKNKTFLDVESIRRVKK